MTLGVPPGVREALAAGAFLGAAGGFWLGVTASFLILRNLLRRVIGAYRELFADILGLCAANEYLIARYVQAQVKTCPSNHGAKLED